MVGANANAKISQKLLQPPRLALQCDQPGHSLSLELKELGENSRSH